jgi:hypothetical protein
VVAAVMLVLIVSAPVLWTRIDPLKPEADYRIPYDLSSDYWLYSRLCGRAVAQHQTAVVGDSVIWGHYVAPDQTLSHCLNAAIGQDRFANLGLDGTHPAALQGLLAYYARSLSRQSVLLHFNPLWLSSEKHDLSATKEFAFNHPKLVPQFVPSIPCYRASFSQRMNAVTERYAPFLSWTTHLRIACFDGLDLPAWTIEHPYENPLVRIADCGLRIADSNKNSNLQSEIRNPKSVIVQWVALEDSIQWRSFRQTVQLLKARQNTVFVLVGPFNEHMLNAEDVTALDRIKKTVDAWLTANDVPHWIAPALPASLYADLSHPVAEGYASLARQLLSEPSFKAILDSPSDR